LKSNYSIRLFELLRQFEFKNERVISLEELRIMLQIEDKYRDFRDFNKRILKPALNELNQKTRYSITIQLIKTLRRVTHIQFYFSIVA
jgi:plasmid replication initiation protein